MPLPKLKIKNFEIPFCIFQGGMGAGVSLHGLASAVAAAGGLGIISSAGLKDIVSLRGSKKVDTYEAVRIELEMAKARGNPIGINIMCALAGSYEASVRASLDAGVDAIISGAGLPLALPSIQKIPDDTALIPIVSSGRALDAISKRWERIGYRPDAVVLEGPLAGGHLGFRMEDIQKPEHQLENLLPQVLEAANKHGGFPVIVAGGIFTHEDIVKFLNLGARGVQIGTRFLATHECDAPEDYKQAVVAAGEEDILVVSSPGGFIPASPCGLPFRLLVCSPMYQQPRKPKCRFGYVKQKDGAGEFTLCQAMPNSPQSKEFLCICSGLLSSVGYISRESLPLYTVGTNAYRIKQIVSVAELMKELING